MQRLATFDTPGSWFLTQHSLLVTHHFPLLLLKNILFTLVFPASVAGYVPWLMTGGQPLGGPAALALAAPLFAVGVSIYTWCVWDFASFGRGTPLPLDAPRRLVLRGLYRYTRNPMYVGVLTTALGWAVLFESARLLLYVVGVWTMFQLFVVLYEEPHLSRVFAAEYEAYRAHVPRWLPWPSGSERRGRR